MAQTPSIATPGATPWGAIAGIIATVSVFAIAQGLTYPLLSFILQRQGVPTALIGLSAAMTPIGFILSAPMVPMLARRFGAGRVALSGAVAGFALLFLIGWTRDPWLWLPLRFLLGAAVNPLYIISETWMISLAPQAKRGRIMGIYASIISAGFATGPLALSLVGTEGWAPFGVGLAAFVVCAVCLASVLPKMPALHGDPETVSVRRFVGKAPLLLFAVLVASGFEQVVLSLMAVYGTGHGSDEARVAALLAVMIAGNIALQVPLGLVAERLGAPGVGALCAAATALGCLALPFLFETAIIWPMIFIWGAISYGMYTMSLVELGERFTGSTMVAGNAAFAMVWGFGGIIGPPLTGGVMDRIGIEGLPLVTGLACVLLAGLRVASMIRARRLAPT